MNKAATDKPGQPNHLITETVQFWADYAQVQISTEDAREALESAFEFFTLLDEWERRQR